MKDNEIQTYFTAVVVVVVAVAAEIRRGNWWLPHDWRAYDGAVKKSSGWSSDHSSEMEYIMTKSQSYQTLIYSFFWFSILGLAVSKYKQYFLILQTLTLNNEKWKKYSFYEEKSLVGLTPGPEWNFVKKVNYYYIVYTNFLHRKKLKKRP
jgi:hypothetical protein